MRHVSRVAPLTLPSPSICSYMREEEIGGKKREREEIFSLAMSAHLVHDHQTNSLQPLQFNERVYQTAGLLDGGHVYHSLPPAPLWRDLAAACCVLLHRKPQSRGKWCQVTDLAVQRSHGYRGDPLHVGEGYCATCLFLHDGDEGQDKEHVSLPEQQLSEDENLGNQCLPAAGGQAVEEVASLQHVRQRQTLLLPVCTGVATHAHTLQSMSYHI